MGNDTNSEAANERQTRVRSRDAAGQIDVFNEDGTSDQTGTAEIVSLKSRDTWPDWRACCRPSYIRRSASSIAWPSSFIDLNPQTPVETVILTGAEVHCSPLRCSISFSERMRRLASFF